MRSTKLRLLDRHAIGALFVLAPLVGGALATACGSDESVRFDDAESDAGTRDDATAPGDELDAGARADAQDATTDDGPFDAAVREVSCESSSCAIALTHPTTRKGESTSGQGFCALLYDKTVACWGSNTDGQLGNGLDDGVASAIPQHVVGLSNIVSVNGACALDEDGAAWCWGFGPFLQDERGYATVARTPVKLPIPGATRISAPRLNLCVLIEGEAECWGFASYGLAPATDGVLPPAAIAPVPIPMPDGAKARDIFHTDFAAFVLGDNGKLWSWGSRAGVGRVTSFSPDRNPDSIALEGVTNVSVASRNACAVANGIPYCWGSDADYALLPEPVVTPERVVQISNTDSVAQLPRRWCAVGGSGAVYCWGYNASGQAGDGTTEYAMTAVKVPLPAPAVHVETTADSTCALLDTGKVLCWGSNYYGQLGNGKFKIPSLVPVEVLLP
ncbi:hypothetical protein AKJ09_06854 [Labilithrix luteola]|uniref:BNR repeat domain protein n=1 Tax=Labilithrix luteola TaxID=1391654 RepID=A0A0K1Q2Z7_9BACT|nr:hypothetical protein [Labilithrix luteola]AKV00191.1 hypothetical protein AKJ09_06854 [Labilithrix luteola]